MPSGSIAYEVIAACTTSDLIVPARASWCKTVTTTWGMSTSKCLRNASRVSLRPIPSVPSGVNDRPGINLATCSGTARIKSVTATIGLKGFGVSLSKRVTSGWRGAPKGCSLFQRSTSSASSRNVLYEVAAVSYTHLTLPTIYSV